MAAFGDPAITPSSVRSTSERTNGTPYMSPPEPRAAPAAPSSSWLSSQAGKDYLKKASQRTATERPARSYGTGRPPSPTTRGDERYFRPEGYVANSTMWSQHAPTPEPVAAPYNPAPPQAPKANVYPTMQLGPSRSTVSGPGSSTTQMWDPAKNKLGDAYASGGMTMDANMANAGGGSMRPQGFTFTAQGVDGKQYANPADAMARRNELIANLAQQQARYSGSMGRNLGAPQLQLPQATTQTAAPSMDRSTPYSTYTDGQIAAYNANMRATGVGMQRLYRDPQTGEVSMAR